MPPKQETKTDDPLTTNDHLQALLHLTTATNNRQDTLTTNMANLVNLLTNQHLNQGRPPPPLPPPPNNNLRPPKIHLPTFNGSNPLDWVFQAENYFTYYSVPPPQRLSLAIFYFTGDALSWYKHMASNNLLGIWPGFTRALELRFCLSTYENHQTTLFKLCQTTSVSAYQTEFEKISNRVIGLSPPTLSNCFISGLRSDIQFELSIHNAQTLHQTFGLAKLIEDKLNAQLSSVDGPSEPPHTNPPLLPAPPPTPQTLPIKRLTPTEMQK